MKKALVCLFALALMPLCSIAQPRDPGPDDPLVFSTEPCKRRVVESRDHRTATVVCEFTVTAKPVDVVRSNDSNLRPERISRITCSGPRADGSVRCRATLERVVKRSRILHRQ